MGRTSVLYILILFFSLSGYAQGIEFSTYESESVQKSSYEVFVREQPLFRDSFTLRFDLAIHDPIESFGYIFRIKDRREPSADTYSLVFSYDTPQYSNLKFNREGKESRLTDTLENALLGPRHWIPVTVRFYLQEDSVSLTVGQKQYVTRHLGLSADMQPDLLFGSSTFSQEMPPFAIRNLSVESKERTYMFPLNESAGSSVHNDQGKIIGHTINPVWLIHKSYHWSAAYTYCSQQVTGSSFDPVSGHLFIFNRDSLIRVDPGRQTSRTGTFPALPLTLRLGTGFYDATREMLYLYEADRTNDFVTAGGLQVNTLDFSPISNQALPSQRHHHACYFDSIHQQYYIFGGFGSRKYYNELYMLDLRTGEWRQIPLEGDEITPRFFCSMGAWSTDELLLFGGNGNPSGDQEAGKIHYYDLYLLNLKEGTVKKLWEFTRPGEDFVPVRQLILSEDRQSFYTLCYPMHLASSWLQLYRFSLEDGTFETLGDSIPMESKAILSHANLYYNSHTHEYYACVQEFQEYGGDPSRITLYTLAAPAIAAAQLFLYTTGSFYGVWPGILGAILLVCAAVGMILYRRKKVIAPEPAVAPETEKMSPLPAGQEIRENAIYLFGEFTVYDKQGKDITYMFSNKTRQLFLLTLMKSLDGSGGITSAYMYGMLWPDKDPKSAKNLKGVFLNRLRKVLEELEGIVFDYHNGVYTLRLAGEIYCDYREYLHLTALLRETTTAHSSPLKQLVGILRRGNLLRSADTETFDAIKAAQEEKLLRLLPAELQTLYQEQHYDRVIDLSEVILRMDPFHDTALWYLLHAYRKIRKEDIAMKKYYLFATEYAGQMGTDYPYSYADILRQSLPQDIGEERDSL